jgi:hypothetical protein
MKKRKTKAELEDLINGNEALEDGGNETPQKTILTYQTVLQKIQSMGAKPRTFRLVVETLNEETFDLIKSLWTTSEVTFIVSSRDLTYLNKVNFDIINRSNSVGRWRVVSPSQVRLEPAELFIICEDMTDVQKQQLPVSETLYFKS